MSELTVVDQEKVAEVATHVTSVVEQAQAIDVRTEAEALAADAFLSQIAKAKRDSENARKFLVKPLNDHVAVINARFKATTAPLDEALHVVKTKVLAWNREQDRLRAEAAARLAAERAEAERQAEAERRRLADEAAAVQRAAAAAEAARRAAIADEDRARRAELAELTDDALHAIASNGVVDDGSPDARDATLAEAELADRVAARFAEAAAEAARAAEEAARVAELQARSAPALAVAAPAQLRSATQKKRWVATVVDETLVPREHLVVNMPSINAAVRDGAREIAGVRIEQVDELSVRAAS